MNGIRLAIFALAALGFLQIDLSTAAAQNQDMGERFKNMGNGQNMGSSQSSPKRSTSTRSGASGRTSGDSDRSTRGRRSSRSSSNNAIKTNPLFKFLDENGDGELSLEEIDAASRLLYSLDANQDDAITSDEVEDMVAGGGSGDGMAGEDDREFDRSTRSARNTRGSDRSSRSTAKSGRQLGKGMGLAGGPSGATPARKASPRSAKSSRKLGKGMSLAGSPDGGSNADDNDFSANDDNNDGFITRGEMPRSLRTKFTKMDANGDKEIDETEWYDYIDNQ